jgi:hypothetical protein
MHDIITPAHQNELHGLMQQGSSYDEAALILFQQYVSTLKLTPENKGRPLTADSLQSLNGLSPSFSPLRPGPAVRATSDDGLTHSSSPAGPKKVSPVGRSGLLRPSSMHSMTTSSTMHTMSAEEGRSRPLSKRNPFAQQNTNTNTSSSCGGSGASSRPNSGSSSTPSTSSRRASSTIVRTNLNI